MKSRAVMAVTVALGVAVAGCSSSSSPPTNDAAGTAATTGSSATASPGTAAPAHTPTAAETIAHPQTSTQVRTSLLLLTQKRLLLQFALARAILDGDAPRADAVRTALDANRAAYTDAADTAIGNDLIIVDPAVGDAWKATLGQSEDAYETALESFAGDVAGTGTGTFAAATDPTLAPAQANNAAQLQQIVTNAKSGDWPAAYTALAAMVGTAPDVVFWGPPTMLTPNAELSAPSNATELTVGLNALLQQHVALASFATQAALAGNTPEFEAAAAVLSANTDALSDAVGSVFGEAAGRGFHDSWAKHIGFFVDYTQGVAGDPAKKAKAASDLTAYADELARFFNAALPDLPRPVLRDLILEHLTGLEAVIDAQGEKNWPHAYTGLADGMDHMSDLGTPLAGSIIKARPSDFSN